MSAFAKTNSIWLAMRNKFYQRITWNLYEFVESKSQIKANSAQLHSQHEKNILRYFWDFLASKILLSKPQWKVGNLTVLHPLSQKAYQVSKLLKCLWSTIRCSMFQGQESGLAPAKLHRTIR